MRENSSTYSEKKINNPDIAKNKEIIKPFYFDKNKNKVFVSEKTREHLLAHPDVIQYLQEAIGKADLSEVEKIFKIEINLGKNIGKSYCIPTEPLRGKTKALFAKRKNRLGPSRVVYGQGVDCSSITLLGARSIYEPDNFVLFTAYIGHLADMEPWDINIKDGETMKSAYDFWRTHALVYDPNDKNTSFIEEPQEKTWEQVMQEMQPIYKKLDEERKK
ncbi:MAG TPA: hypothetical protein PKH95_02815 [Candidatus Magasanikbacteria bacterium]|nr:hypothetical protein [Candidatus Magasanikbacteria bacterium]